MIDPSAIPNILNAQKHHASHPLIVATGVATGVYVGSRTKDTAVGKTVGTLIWIGVGLALWGCLGASLFSDTNPPDASSLFVFPLIFWLGWKCIWIGIRPSVGRPAEMARGAGRVVAYMQPAYDCCRHCAGCRIRDVHPTPCGCAGQTALDVRRG